MNINYQKRLDYTLDAQRPGEKSLLLHSCCGPCSSYVLEYLTQYFKVTVLYYNPNIQPEREYEKRLVCQRELIESLPQASRPGILEVPYLGHDFSSASKWLENEPEGGARCTECFRLRLNKTAAVAAEHGFDYFCTTLTVSPHKDAQRINRIGEQAGEQYGVAWLPSDFKKKNGYRRSVELARRYGLYRQDYCGCKYSMRHIA